MARVSLAAGRLGDMKSSAGNAIADIRMRRWSRLFYFWLVFTVFPFVCLAQPPSTLPPVGSTSDSPVNPASDETFFDSWRAGGEATASVIGDMHLTKTQISWDGSTHSPPCSAGYQVIERKTGQGHYPDEPWPYSAMSERSAFISVRLRLGNQSCEEDIAYMLLVIRPSSPNALAVVAYDANGAINGFFSFGRLPASKRR